MSATGKFHQQHAEILGIAESVHAALAQRVQRDNTELYPLLDKVG